MHRPKTEHHDALETECGGVGHALIYLLPLALSESGGFFTEEWLTGTLYGDAEALCKPLEPYSTNLTKH